MKIIDIVKLTNRYLAGEQLTFSKLLPFLDATIDDINDRLNASYPSFSSLADRVGEKSSYDYFPDRYIRSVVCIGAAHKFYVMDEEGISYDQTFYEDYEKGLFFMTRDFIDRVPPMFQSDSDGSVVLDETDQTKTCLPFDFTIGDTNGWF